ncbi:IS5 family transposase [Hymenobacter lapidiphilus]|uniref:IS5 family transposase n=1 Tax=Hymenobacter lapidiphilus TaxID=2608003 RepID=A0A7Y7PM08_9BACT|nr:IS5 family transposase [Hymenobacter lapidiphilus]NVO30274.1 IS5 family transposase [Hymenobacter lapidiphilus]
MEVLSKDIITTWILPHLPLSSHGRRRLAQPQEVVGAILYKLKTGCQWRWLPVQQLLPTQRLSWQGVYYYFNEWRKQGAWKQLWLSVLRQHRRALDLSSIQLDGSHTPAKNGGAAIGYQGRKAARTTNALFLADNTGQPLAVSTPQAGNHHDTFCLELVFAELCELLKQAQLRLAGLFLNADKAFDVKSLRQQCAERAIEVNIPRNRRATDWQTDDDTPLDPELYRRRLVIEQMNAWLDGFKTLLVRYETCLENWLAFHWLAFVVLLLRKIAPPPTS